MTERNASVVWADLAKHQASALIEKRPHGGWKTIRVFISSTFSDMFSERERLVKHIVPQLRRVFEGQKLRVVEVDLRWGLPKAMTGSEALYTCVHELQRCRHENTNPFFLSLISERYGWVPAEITADLRVQFGFVNGFSLTAMEAILGAYADRNPNALFLFRNPDFLEQLPDLKRQLFEDGNKSQLLLLKTKIRERFPADQVAEYSVRVDGRSAQEELLLTGLEDQFTSLVMQHFTRCIAAQYPLGDAPQQVLSLLERETATQSCYIDLRGAQARVIGRRKILGQISEYLEDRGPDSEMTGAMEIEDEQAAGPQGASAAGASAAKDTVDGNQVEPAMIVAQAALGGMHALVLTGEPGAGKSSILAKVAADSLASTSAGVGETAAVLPLILFFHFVGSAPGSTDAVHMLRRLWYELHEQTIACDQHSHPQGQQGQQHTTIPTDISELVRGLPSVLKRAAKVARVRILIDALEELEKSGDSGAEERQQQDEHRSLAWLPPSLLLPVHCRVVLSTTEGSEFHQRLRQRQLMAAGQQTTSNLNMDAASIELQCAPLDHFSRAEVMRLTLADYNKTIEPQVRTHLPILSPPQCHLLTHAPPNPLGQPRTASQPWECEPFVAHDGM
jgi:hypothetical protein